MTAKAQVREPHELTTFRAFRTPVWGTISGPGVAQTTPAQVHPDITGANVNTLPTLPVPGAN